MCKTNLETPIHYLYSYWGTWRDPYLHGIFTSKEKAETYRDQAIEHISKYGTSGFPQHIGFSTWDILEGELDVEFSLENY